jgi:hypothetical protein
MAVASGDEIIRPYKVNANGLACPEQEIGRNRSTAKTAAPSTERSTERRKNMVQYMPSLSLDVAGPDQAKAAGTDDRTLAPTWRKRDEP